MRLSGRWAGSGSFGGDELGGAGHGHAIWRGACQEAVPDRLVSSAACAGLSPVRISVAAGEARS